jgi:chemotaxis protein MotB
MYRNLKGLSALTAALFILAGCAAQDEYLIKQAEVEALNNHMAVLTQQNHDLLETVAGLEGNVGELREAKDRLAGDCRVLEDQYRTRLSQAERTIGELRRRNFELDGDRQMLAEGMALLRKSREVEVKKVSGTYEELLTEMKGEIEKGQIAITELKGKLTVDVVDRILFDSGQADVKPEGLAILKRVVDILITAADKQIRVEGHTDNIQIGGALARRYPTNWELSAARALNVTRYLEKEGIDPAILSAAAYGEHRPVAGNDTPEGRAKNRRIAIILLPKD